jgi:hypothetical protein
MQTGQFHSSAREAKEFLVSRIVEEANREDVSLSEVERKMLYFSETDWTLPDIMEVNEQFDREYDQDDYEKKIKNLIIAGAKHDRKESSDQYDSWLEAIRILEKEDHYILVMAQAAGLRPRGDQMKLLVAGLCIVGTVLVAAFLDVKYGNSFSRFLPPGTGRILYCLVIGGVALAAYRLGWMTRL